MQRGQNWFSGRGTVGGSDAAGAALVIEYRIKASYEVRCGGIFIDESEEGLSVEVKK